MTAGLHSCHDRCSRPACVMRRERDEARAELDHMRQGYDRVRADRDYHCDRAIAAVAERDEARAQLAALREAADAAFEWLLRIPWDPQQIVTGSQDRIRLRTALSDTAVTAEAYTRRVALAGECRGMRLAADRLSAQPVTAGLLREWADEIEGGR